MSDDKVNQKVIKRLKERDNMGISIQADIDALSEKIKKLCDHDLKTYLMLSAPDSLFNDSPISNFWTYHHIKQYMIKKDMDFLGYVLDGKMSVKPLGESIRESEKWVLRFAKEAEVKKTGIEAIL